MSEDRETQQAGSPVEESEATETEVLAAVERARDTNDPAALANSTDAEETVVVDSVDEGSDGAGPENDARDVDEPESPLVLPAAPTRTPASRRPVRDSSARAEADSPEGEQTAALSVAETEALLGEPRDGEIRVSADHPMAALYMQTPMPPEFRGNRGAGVLISLLATVVFAVLYAGLIALRISSLYPPSTFLTDGLLPFLTSWGFIAAVASFFVSLILLVLISGRAGWWAYVIGGLPVAIIVWAATTVGYALSPEVLGAVRTGWNYETIISTFGLTVPALGAALIAREVTAWFGAWIGRRGRKVTQRNAEALADYEEALAEVRAKR
ncbi:hypothetical protein [Leucobacter sp. GX24907]